MQIAFPIDKARAQIGQKVDAIQSLVVSSVANTKIAFGSLVLYDDSDAFLCKPPTSDMPLDKPLGITLRQQHCEDYQPKTSIAVMRKGRVWVEADKVSFPGDSVYIRFLEDGSARFTGDKENAMRLFGAIFLEKSSGGLTPIEVDFFGGVQ